MTDLEKLKHLLDHWMEHNDAHVKTYSEWADKAASMDRKDIAEILNQIMDESKNMNTLFEKARKII